jgi:hypothetical protein
MARNDERSLASRATWDGGERPNMRKGGTRQ